MELISSASLGTTNTATLMTGLTASAWNVTTKTPRKVFISSASYTGAIGSVAAADSDCATLAAAAGLSGSFKAWISVTTASDDPNTRFIHNTIPYQDVSGTTIANNWTGLVSGTLVNGISKNESGASVTAGTSVWTNTTITGTATSSGSSTSNCSGWTSALSARNAPVGATGSPNNPWTASGTAACNTAAVRIYCFQQ
jgi:hypothetical protein